MTPPPDLSEETTGLQDRGGQVKVPEDDPGNLEHLKEGSDSGKPTQIVACEACGAEPVQGDKNNAETLEIEDDREESVIALRAVGAKGRDGKLGSGEVVNLPMSLT
eukprot:2181191-Pyramimonas_sp.AAC.1